MGVRSASGVRTTSHGAPSVTERYPSTPTAPASCCRGLAIRNIATRFSTATLRKAVEVRWPSSRFTSRTMSHSTQNTGRRHDSSSTKHNSHILDAQHARANFSLGAYRTSPSSSLCVLANEPPLYYSLKL